MNRFDAMKWFGCVVLAVVLVVAVWSPLQAGFRSTGSWTLTLPRVVMEQTLWTVRLASSDTAPIQRRADAQASTQSAESSTDNSQLSTHNSNKRYAGVSFGPVDAVEEKVDELDEKANKHWKNLYEKCTGNPEFARNCPEADIPLHVWAYWRNNPGNQPASFGAEPAKGSHGDGSGSSGSADPVQQTKSAQWAVAAGGPVTSSPSISNDGTVYATAQNGNLLSVTAGGVTNWTWSAGVKIQSSPLIGPDTNIYFGSHAGELHKVNESGIELWSHNVGDWVVASPVMGADSTIYVGSIDGTFTAVDPTGTEEWSIDLGDSITSTAAVAGDSTIYVGTWGNELVALNANGTVKWTYATDGPVKSSPAIGGDGTVYVGSSDQHLYAINPNGTLQWRSQTGGAITGGVAIGADSTVYVGSWDHNLYAFQPNGTQKWTFETGNRITATPTVGDTGVVYVGSGDGAVYGIDTNGDGLWKVNTGSPVTSSVAIGSAYVGSGDGNLYSLDVTSSGLANSPWPRFRKNNKGDGSGIAGQGVTPTISIQSPLAVADTNVSPITVSGATGNTNTGDSVQLFVNGAVQDTIAVGGGGGWSTPSATLSASTNTIDAVVYETSPVSLAHDTATITVNYDTVAPLPDTTTLFVADGLDTAFYTDLGGDSILRDGNDMTFSMGITGADTVSLYYNRTGSPASTTDTRVLMTNVSGTTWETTVSATEFNLGDSVNFIVRAKDNATNTGVTDRGGTGHEFEVGTPPHSGPTWYVNDNDTTGDVFTARTGNDSASGSSQFPFRTISHAMTKVSAGDTVRVDAGTYGETVAIDTNALALVGVDSSPTGTVIDPGDSTAGVLKSGIIVQGFTGPEVRNLRVTNAYNGIRLVDAPFSTIRNATFEQNGNYGVFLNDGTGNGSDTSTIKNVVSRNNDSYGFEVINSDSLTLTNSLAKNNTGNGIYLSGSSEGYLANNLSDGNDTHGFVLTSGANNNTVTGNTSTNNGDRGFNVDTANGNTLSNNSSSGNVNYGYFLTSADSNTLSNNTSTGNGFSGITLQGSSFNTLTGNTSSNDGSDGIVLQSSSDTNTVNNNVSKNNPAGFYTLNSSNIEFTGNVSKNNTGYGFRISSGSDFTVRRNRSVNNDGNGFALFTISNSTLTQNTADSNTNWGVSLEGSGTGDTITKNNIMPGPTNPDSGLTNTTGNTQTITLNYWNVTDRSLINQRVDDPINDPVPYRLGKVDTGVGADTVAPQSPVGDTVIVGDQQLEVRWQSITAPGDFAEYRLYRSTSDILSDWKQNATLVATNNTITDTDYVDTGLVNGQSYYYRVTAVDNATLENESYFSDTVTGTPQLAPASFDTTTIQAGNGGETLTVAQLDGTSSLADTANHTISANASADTVNIYYRLDGAVASTADTRIVMNQTGADTYEATISAAKINANDTVNFILEGLNSVGDTTIEDNTGQGYAYGVSGHQGPTWYVNDNDTTGDVFTSAIGDDTSGNGSVDAPFRTISHALTNVSAGDTVRVDAGTFGETVAINTDNLALVGADSTATVLDFGDSSTTTSGILVQGRTGVEIRNLRVINSFEGIDFDNTSNSRIESVASGYHGNRGVVVRNGSNLNTLTNNESFNNTSRGFQLRSDSNTLTNSLSRDNDGAGIYLDAAGNTVANNVSSSNNDHGVVLGSIAAEANTFDSNVSRNNTSRGFDVTWGGTNTFTSNTSENNGSDGFYFINSSNNTLTNNTIRNNSDAGIRVDGVTRIKLVQNAIRSNTGWGISIENGASQGTFTKNNIMTSVTNPDSGLSNTSGNAHTITDNYWNTTDLSVISQRVADPINSVSPYRLGEVDTGIGADTIAPAQPTIVSQEAGDGTAAIEWTRATATDFQSYRVYRDTNAGQSDWKQNADLVATINTVTDTSHVDTGLTNGDTHYYRVTAVDNVTPENESFFSDSAAVRPAHDGPVWYVNDNSTTGDSFTTAVGSDSNTGGPGDPFGSVSKAMNKVSAGDTVKIDAGTYVDTVTVNTNGLAFVGVDSGATVLTSSDSASTDNIGFSGSSQSNLLIRDLKITDMYHAIEFSATTRTRVKHVRVDQSGNQSVRFTSGSDTTVIRDVTVTNGPSMAFNIDGDSTTIKNSLAKNNGGNGFRVANSRNVMIRNNRSINNGFKGFVISSTNRTELRNNVSRDNSSQSGFQLDNGSDTNVLVNNLSLNNGDDGFSIAGSGNTIKLNQMKDNANYGVVVDNGNSNRIARNNLLTNGVWNVDGNTIPRNWWNTTDETTIAGKIDVSVDSAIPYRLGEIDTGVGADTLAPASPVVDTAIAGYKSVEVRWQAIPNTAGDFKEYRVYRDTDLTSDWKQNASVVATNNTVNDTTIDDTGLVNGQTYYYRVTAVDTHTPENESFFSDTMTATPSALPSSFDTSTLTVSDGTDTLTYAQLDGGNNLGDTFDHSVRVRAINADTVNLYYRRDGTLATTADTKLPLTNTAADTYEGILPDTDITGGDTVNFILEGINSAGDTVIEDSGGAGYEYWVYKYDGPTWYVNDDSTANDVYTSAKGNDTSGIGSSNDPFRTIGKAMTKVSAGDTVRVDAGSYGETVTIPVNNLALVGADSSPTGTVIDYGDSTSGTGAVGILASAQSELTVKDLRITNTWRGIHFDNADTSTIRNVNSLLNGRYGIHLNSGSDGNLVKNSVMNENSSIGLKVEIADQNTIRENTARNNSADGINLAGGSTNNALDTNTVSSNSGSGIQLTTSSLSNVLRGNRVVNNGSDGVTVDGGANLNQLINNTVRSNTNDGIALSSADTNTVKRNLLKNNTNGIYLFNTSGNTVALNKLTSNTSYQVYLTGVTSGQLVKKNNILVSGGSDSFVFNDVAGETFDLTRNWWGTTDESTISGKIDGTSSDSIVSIPYRLGAVDTGAGADTVAPAKPVADTAIAGTTSVTVTWQEVTQDEDGSGLSGFSEYRVYRDTTLPESDWKQNATLVGTASPASDTDFVDGGLQAGQTYHYRVTAVDNPTGLENESFFSDTMTATPHIFDQVSQPLSVDSGVLRSSIQWGDYDDDGDLDLVVTGEDGSGNNRLIVYRNDGGGNFTKVAEPMGADAGVRRSSVQWGDYDNDGDLDLVVSGSDNSNTRRLIIYRNDGGGVFTNVAEPMTGDGVGLYRSSVQWGDYDNDGDLDLVVSGDDENTDNRLIVFRNDGGDSFVKVAEPMGSTNGLVDASIQWGDYDNDGDLDFAAGGWDNGSTRRLIVFRNDGSGNFTNATEPMGAGNGLSNGSIQWGDYNSDGDLDLVVSGNNNSLNERLFVFRNDGDGSFTNVSEPMGTNTGVDESSLQWADFNNNGELDLLVSGIDNSGNERLIAYRNDGGGMFSKVAEPMGTNQGLMLSSVQWGDHNVDGLLDFVASGRDVSSNPRLIVFQNNGGFPANNRPSAPTLNAPLADTIVKGDTINFDWNPSSDVESAQASLTYNLRVGSTSNGVDIVSADTDDSDSVGRRILGNVQNGSTHYLKSDSLPTGTYHWSVQAVDPGQRRSQWATEDTFSVVVLPPSIQSNSIRVTDGNDTLTPAQLDGTNNLGDTFSHDIDVRVSNADTVNLYYRRDGTTATTADTQIPLTNTTGDTYQGVLPDTDITGGDTVNFILEGINSAGDTVIEDSGGAGYEYWVYKYDGPTWYVNDDSSANDVYTSAKGNDTSGIGSSNDPFRTISKAMTKVSAGDTVKVDAGTYGETVTIPVNSLALVGADSSATGTVIDFGDSTGSQNANTIKSVGNSNLLVKNMRIKNSDTGLYFSNVDFSKIEQLTVRQIGNSGIVFDNNSDTNQITSSLSVNNSKNGIFLSNSSANNSLDSNTIKNNTADGILIECSSRNTVNSNVSKGNRDGFNTLSSTCGTSDNNKLVNNTSSNNGRFGFSISSGSNLIKQNTSRNNSDAGMQIDGSNNKLLNNTIENNVTSSFPIRPAGLYIRVVSNINVFQNEIQDNENHQIHIESGASNIKVSKNNFRTSSTFPDSGILNNTTSETFSFQRNFWNTTDRSGIQSLIDGTGSDSIIISPYRLGEVDTGVGADTVAPADVIGDTAVARISNRIEVSWQEVTTDENGNGLSDFQAYRVYRDTTGTLSDWKQNATVVATITDSADTDHVDTGLTSGSTYHYRVTAVDNATPENESFFSDTVTATAKFWDTGVLQLPAKNTGAGHVSAPNSDTLYVTGGQISGSASDTVWAYSDTVGWTSSTSPDSLPRTVRNHSTIMNTTGDTLFVVGGVDGAQNLVEVRAYDFRSNTWDTYPAMPKSHRFGEAQVLGDTLYVIGGDQDSNLDSDVMTYDLTQGTSGTWDTGAVPNIPTGRKDFETVVASGNIYAMGGDDGTGNIASVVSYDPASNSWTSQTALPTALSSHASALFDGQIYVAGGNNGSVVDGLHIYDVAGDSWMTGQSLPGTGRQALIGGISGKQLIMAGGNNGSVALDTVNRARP